MGKRPILGVQSWCVLLALGIIASTPAASQTSTVVWSSFNEGFARTLAANTEATSAVGQIFVGSGRLANTWIESGFLGDTLFQGPMVSVPDNEELPKAYVLAQNYPNPFNPVTNFQFSIVSRQMTILKVYDVLGRQVATLVNELKEPGLYTIQWDASGHSSGVYFYTMQAGKFVSVKKLVLLR